MTPREEFLIDLSNIITTSVSLGSEISGLNDDEDANTDYLQKLTDDFTEKWAPKDEEESSPYTMESFYRDIEAISGVSEDLKGHIDDELTKLMEASKIELSDIEDKPTVVNPQDFYTVYERHKEECELFGINSLEDLDQFIKRMFKEEDWPSRLKDDAS